MPTTTTTDRARVMAVWQVRAEQARTVDLAAALLGAGSDPQAPGQVTPERLGRFLETQAETRLWSTIADIHDQMMRHGTGDIFTAIASMLLRHENRPALSALSRSSSTLHNLYHDLDIWALGKLRDALAFDVAGVYVERARAGLVAAREARLGGI